MKNIYVDINDCPFWMQDNLKQIRKTELAEPKVNHEKVKVLENTSI